jgi:acyl carrier protein
MSNLEKYDAVFFDTFGLTQDKLPGLEYNTIVEWDSVGHMQLIATLEDAFDINLDMDDIVDFGSYKKGKEILSKYNIIFE